MNDWPEDLEVESLEELQLEQQVACPECGTLCDEGEACEVCGHRPN